MPLKTPCKNSLHTFIKQYESFIISKLKSEITASLCKPTRYFKAAALFFLLDFCSVAAIA